MMNNIELKNELKGLENDKKIHHLGLEHQKNKIANELKGSMGQDMKDVLNGKKNVNLSKFERFKFKFNYYLDKLFKIL